MTRGPDGASRRKDFDALPSYRLSSQIGHILRRASQRHSTIFAEQMVGGLTPTRFAALAMLFERGHLSQNELGRLTAMDIATIKGVVDRLSDKGLVAVRPDPDDGRRNLISLTDQGLALVEQAIPAGKAISKATLKPLSSAERKQLVELLKKIT